MSRKRSNPIKQLDEPKHINQHINQRHIDDKKKSRFKGKPTIALLLLGIFALVLLFNFYFNYTSGIGINPAGTDVQTKYLLSGPDPYYNLRTIRWTLETGHYPWADPDLLLEYPINIVRGGGSGARPPLMNMLAIIVHFPLTLVMPQMDALGFSMQFLPALFGALLVFPIYYLGKELFNPKVGLIAALFISLIPVHLSSGHGSAFTLFDHDALILLLFAVIYLFYIRSIKEKNNIRSICYASLAGLTLAAMTMLWVEARYTYAVLLIFFVLQIFVNILRSNNDLRFVRNTLLVWVIGYLIALPMNLMAWHYVFRMDTPFVFIVLAFALGTYCFFIKKVNIPWVVSIPLLGGLAAAAFAAFHFMPQTTLFAGFSDINRMIFGSGIYGSQTALTIAEARTFDMSRWIMSFGPSLFLIAIVAGLPFILFKWYKTKRYDFFFIAVWFIVTTWLNTIAGRFINDYVPLVALLSAIIVYTVIEKINYKKMIRTVRDIGGFHGIRKGIRFYHIAGVFFIAFVIVLPNAYMAFDAAIPTSDLQKFGKKDSTFGLSTYKEMYWTESLQWLAKQDTAIKETWKRPGFISWWDYGFQEVAVGDHPTVADNYQRGIECAANFQTAGSEKEAIAVLSVLLLRADSLNGSFSASTDSMLRRYLMDYNDTVYDNATKTNVTVTHHPVDEIEEIILDPIKFAPSFNKRIGNFPISAMNALYRDCVSIFNRTLSEEQMIQVYEELQKITGYSVRYYGTEGYDMDIFNVFSFLSSKGTFGYSGYDDRYYYMMYVDKNGKTYTPLEVEALSETEINTLGPFNPQQYTKDALYETMVVRAYRGTKDTYIPGYGLKHFGAQYISPYPYPGTSNPAVVISKYYPGGFINGTVFVGDMPFSGISIAFLDRFDIPHDMQYSEYGSYSLVSLAGNFSINVYLGDHILKSVKFNGTSAISEDEADRKVPHSRSLDIEIDYAHVSGHIQNGSGMTVGFYNEYFDIGEQKATIDAFGNYSISNLVPSEYSITIYSGGKTIQSETAVYLSPGNQTYNASVTKGVIYGAVDSSVGTMTLRLRQGNHTISTIDYNTSVRTYEISPVPIGDYTITFYENASSIDSSYAVLVNIAPGAKEFDIDANPQ
jgi:dolichyl-phosphooligosaccharide-protein glycotransferase